MAFGILLYEGHLGLIMPSVDPMPLKPPGWKDRF